VELCRRCCRCGGRRAAVARAAAVGENWGVLAPLLSPARAPPGDAQLSYATTPAKMQVSIKRAAIAPRVRPSMAVRPVRAVRAIVRSVPVRAPRSPPLRSSAPRLPAAARRARAGRPAGAGAPRREAAIFTARGASRPRPPRAPRAARAPARPPRSIARCADGGATRGRGRGPGGARARRGGSEPPTANHGVAAQAAAAAPAAARRPTSRLRHRCTRPKRRPRTPSRPPSRRRRRPAPAARPASAPPRGTRSRRSAPR